MTRKSKLFKNKIKHMHNLDASMNKNKKCIKVEIIKSCKVHKYIYIYICIYNVHVYPYTYMESQLGLYIHLYIYIWQRKN